MTRPLLKLYITGRTVRSQKAVFHLRKMFEPYGDSAVEFEVIDVLENPGRAEEDRVLATPTLIYESGGSTSRLIGDFSDPAQVLQLLGLSGNHSDFKSSSDSEERNEGWK